MAGNKENSDNTEFRLWANSFGCAPCYNDLGSPVPAITTWWRTRSSSNSSNSSGSSSNKSNSSKIAKIKNGNPLIMEFVWLHVVVKSRKKRKSVDCGTRLAAPHVVVKSRKKRKSVDCGTRLAALHATVGRRKRVFLQPDILRCAFLTCN